MVVVVVVGVVLMMTLRDDTNAHVNEVLRNEHVTEGSELRLQQCCPRDNIVMVFACTRAV